MGNNDGVKPRNLYDEVLIDKMNLTADYIYNRIGYNNAVRIYHYFMYHPDNSKRWLYDNESNSHLNQRTLDHIWRNYQIEERKKSLFLIGELLEESKRASLCMQTIATY
jgi:hypothetical protein